MRFANPTIPRARWTFPSGEPRSSDDFHSSQMDSSAGRAATTARTNATKSAKRNGARDVSKFSTIKAFLTA